MLDPGCWVQNAGCCILYPVSCILLSSEDPVMTRLENWTNRTFDEIHVGDTATLTHKLTQDVIEVFALISGDVDPFVLEGDVQGEAQITANTAHAAAAVSPFEPAGLFLPMRSAISAPLPVWVILDFECCRCRPNCG